jgi:hypothetical protein
MGMPHTHTQPIFLAKKIPHNLLLVSDEPLCFLFSPNKGHEWMIGVSVSFSGSILHLKLTPNKLTPYMHGYMCYFCI